MPVLRLDLQGGCHVAAFQPQVRMSRVCPGPRRAGMGRLAASPAVRMLAWGLEHTATASREPEMPEPILPVETFWDATEAHLARGALEEAGIDSVVADDNAVAVMPLHVGAIGGVKLLVRESDLARARKVLDGLEGEEDESDLVEDESDLPRCPRCNSDDVTYERFSKRGFFVGVLLLGFPFLVMKHKWRCLTCEHEWEE